MHDEIKSAPEVYLKVNVGCGNLAHPDWLNLDFSSLSPNVKQHDILSGLPFNDSSVDALYASHFLEHLSLPDAKKFLEETYRVLKDGGIIRIVVPDFFASVCEYIKIIDEIDESGEVVLYKKAEYIYVEIFDQMTRDVSGGRLIEYLSATHPLKDYVEERLGAHHIDYRHNDNVPFFQKIKKTIPCLLHWIYRAIGKVNHPDKGELHKWAYDKFMLKYYLQDVGFRDYRVMDHLTSQIPAFSSFGLDTFENGTPRKGSTSLYVEAKK